MGEVTKIIDTVKLDGSRLDNYWLERNFAALYKAFRRGVDIPARLRQVDNAAQVQERYHFAGFQFGNWVSNEDRYNYLAALYISCYDLNKILKFNNNDIGFKALNIAFGARGHGPAVAHYEPLKQVINITRYHRDAGATKTQAFILSGGIGAFAHEYGHFLDYYIGQYYAPSAASVSLTGGRSLARKRQAFNDAQPMRSLVEDILQAAYWDEPYTKASMFYKRVKAHTDSDYYVWRNEVFARLFEQYISYKLQAAGIYNRFLSEVKYEPIIYMNGRELKKVVPLFDKLIELIRKIS